MPVGARDDARVQHGRFPGVGKGLSLFDSGQTPNYHDPKAKPREQGAEMGVNGHGERGCA